MGLGKSGGVLVTVGKDSLFAGAIAESVAWLTVGEKAFEDCSTVGGVPEAVILELYDAGERTAAVGVAESGGGEGVREGGKGLVSEVGENETLTSGLCAVEDHSVECERVGGEELNFANEGGVAAEQRATEESSGVCVEEEGDGVHGLRFDLSDGGVHAFPDGVG